MIADIQDTLKDIEQHLDNINELVPGMSDAAAEMMLLAVREAENNLRVAHSYLVGPDNPNLEEPRWEA